jgi:hypothetical protein
MLSPGKQRNRKLEVLGIVSPIAFGHNLRLSPTPAHAQPRGIRTYRREPLVFHGVLPLKRPASTRSNFSGYATYRDLAPQP